MTPEELSDKFTNMKKETEEGVLSGLKAACIIIVGKAYDNCSPAKTPYFRPIWVLVILHSILLMNRFQENLLILLVQMCLMHGKFMRGPPLLNRDLFYLMQ